jgi:hypothetical protein
MAQQPVPINPADDVRGTEQDSDGTVLAEWALSNAADTAPAPPQQLDDRVDAQYTDAPAKATGNEAPERPQTDRPISAAKLAANRKNSQHSTGPKTPAGKKRSRWNAVRHGLFAKHVVINTGALRESREEFDQLCAALRRDLTPKGALEELLVDRVAECYWRHARLLRVENTEIDRAMRSSAAELHYLANGRPREETMELPPERVDRTILRREAMHDSHLYRALHALERRQRARRGEDVDPPMPDA